MNRKLLAALAIVTFLTIADLSNRTACEAKQRRRRFTWHGRRLISHRPTKSASNGNSQVNMNSQKPADNDDTTQKQDFDNQEQVGKFYAEVFGSGKKHHRSLTTRITVYKAPI